MKNFIISAIVAAIVAVIVVVVGGNNQPAPDKDLGASGTRFPNGISADTTSPVRGEVRGTTFTLTGDAVIGGGNGALTLTTSNTATSTATIGCIQTYATSTQTPVRFVLSSTGTTTATFGAGTANGGVSWQYGTCPI